MDEKTPSKKTQVIWTCEVSKMPKEPLKLIEKSNIDCIRLITRPGDLNQLKEVIGAIRNRPPELKKIPITFMVDLYTDNKIELNGEFDPEDLSVNDKITIYGKDSSQKYYINLDQLTKTFKPNLLTFLGHGDIILETISADDEKVTFQVLQAGLIRKNMEVSVPDTKKDIEFTPEVIRYLEEIGKLGVDFLTVSGISTLEDALKLNSIIEKTEIPPWHLLKINSKKILTNLKPLLSAVKGVVLGRTELALGVGPANIPLITKDIIHTCNDHAKLILIASDILKSMRYNATPTRAEVSDIGNAVYDGADGVILSEDIALGPYSSRSWELAQKTIDDVESHSSTLEPEWEKETPDEESLLSAVTYGAYKTANRNGAKALVCLTKSGNTALHLSSFRTDTPIIAVTYTRDVQKKLNIIRGVESLILENYPKMDELLAATNTLLKNHTWLEIGDKYIFVSVTLSQIGKDSSNLFTIQSVH